MLSHGRALAWLPGRPATEGDVLLVAIVMVLLWMCTACRISSYPNVISGMAMVGTLLAQFYFAWQLMRAWENVTYEDMLLSQIDESAGWNMDWGTFALFCLLVASSVATALVSVPSVGSLVRRLLDPALQRPYEGCCASKRDGDSDSFAGGANSDDGSDLDAFKLTVPVTLSPSLSAVGAVGAPSLTVLLPCYLPNEQGLVVETIDHIRRQLDYPVAFDLLVCYNSPTPLPGIEAELEQLNGGRDGPRGNTLSVLKVEGSTSKAENLNEALKQVSTEHVVIYDADHHPDPESLRIMTAFMRRHNATCVQGSTYIRQLDTFLARVIDAEFFIIFFVFFAAMETATGMGWFGGSNALWRTSALKKSTFRRDVLTEDVELSTRLLVGRHKIVFCPEARSGELPPANLRALWNQRIRWLTGWDQVTLRHVSTIYKARDLHPCKKLGLAYILPARWAMLALGLVNSFTFPILKFGMNVDPFTLGWPIILCFNYGFASLFTVILIGSISAGLYEYRRPLQIVFVVGFAVFSLLYLFWQLLMLCMSCSRICSGNDSTWVVTQRATKPPTPSVKTPPAASPTDAPSPPHTAAITLL